SLPAGRQGVGKFNVDADVGDISAFPVIRGIKKEMVKDENLDRDIAGSIGGALTKLEVFLKPSSLQLDFADPGDISLLVEDMLRVKLGDMEKLPSKIDVLEALLPQVEGKWNDVSYIDIRYINNPVIKMRH
ncbi:MAG: cell division protein FtsQ/DivIB, partial [Candidatus Saganbacteria bacterium]|nr:cell division protein FtsQ/DivIB [Candidatus Saganbacteria bacterium]